MIDTHAHLDTEAFDDDRVEALRRAFSCGVKKIIIPAIGPKGFNKLLEIVREERDEEKESLLYCGVGVHPHNALEAGPAQLREVEELCSGEKVAAVGETGLDYHYDFAPADVQKNVFRAHLRIAKERGLPVIVHNRESDDDLIQILQEEQDGRLRGALHCFSSGLETLRKALDLGFYVSFTGNITFKNSRLADVVRQAPIDRLMLETDSPYMAPVPFRGKRNEPSALKLIAEKIAEIKFLSIEEVISMTSNNAERLFRMAVLALIFFLSSLSVFSQDEEDIYYEDDEFFDEEIEKELESPYPKFIGFGPILGFNTIVETAYFENDDLPVSYEGILAFGASISYCPFDFLIVEAAYIYSKNTKIAEEWEYALEPSTYQIIELTTKWIPNPYGRINLYGALGGTLFFNSLGGPNKTFYRSNQLGINFGVGMFVNIKSGAGMITPSFEWRLDFAFGRTSGKYPKKSKIDPDKTIFVQYEKTSFFSIPRICVTWYPSF